MLDANGREIEGNGVDLTERQRQKMLKQNCTVGEAQEMAVQIAEHYMAQVPGLVEQIVRAVVPGLVAAMLEVHGITLEPPPGENPE